MSRNQNTRSQKRGAVTKADCKLISLWVPEAALRQLDQAVDALDTDRSKFIRRAIQHALKKQSA